MRNTKLSLLIIMAIFLGLGISPSNIITNHIDYSFIESDDGDGLSIILMIGDGMGFEHINISRLVEKGLNGHLTLEQLDFNSSVMTYNANAAITDSAASATAIATGVKTNNGMIAMNPTEESLTTILEIANSSGKATGLVSTTSIQHATPAAFMTHVKSRNNITEITRQIVEEADVDVILGGGASYFSSSHLDVMEARGYEIVDNKTGLQEATSGKVLGLFAGGHMSYEISRNFELTPSIAEMTNKSIEILSQDSDGFFLMVEGGRIDHAGHANNKTNVALDTIAFDNAVDIALQYVQNHENTILIVTADHETGGLSVLNSNLNETLPSQMFSEERNRTLRVARANNVSVSWSTDYHTDTPVSLYAYGKAFENLTSGILIDNIDVFDIMVSYYAGEDISLTNFTDIRIDSPEDIEYEAGTNDNILEWKPYDPLPHSFVLMRNDSELDSGPWNGSEIVVPIDGLELGVYNYTVFVNDTSNNYVFDSVLVTVVDTTNPIVEDLDDIEYEIGTGQLPIIWTVYDLYPDAYKVLQNGFEYTSGPWNESDIEISISVELDSGVHNFTLFVNDTTGNMATDTVFVFVNDTTNPVSNEPTDITYEAGSSGHLIIWNFDEFHPSNYTVYRNGSELVFSPWDGSEISISIDNLNPSIYNYTIIVMDTFGNVGIDTVLVMIEDTTDPVIDEPEDIQIQGGSEDNTIVWSPSDLYPASYSVFLNGTEIISPSIWDGSDIILSIDSSALGVFNYSLLVIDESGNWEVDVVIVSVIDSINPIIETLSDFDYEAGSTGIQISWNVTDVFPFSFVVLRNDSIVYSGEWNGSEIVISIDSLSLGIYNFSLFVNDTSGNSASDVVLVSVVDTTAPTVNHPSDIQYTEGQTGYLITWTLEDLYPSRFEITMNETSVRTGTWNASNGVISISVDGLSPAFYKFRIDVSDTSGNVVTDIVNVIVQPEEITSVTTSTTTTSATENNQALYTAGIVVTVVTLILLILLFVKIRRKR